MATSGEDFGWPERFTRAFCAKIKATYSVGAVNRPVLAEIDTEECRFCRKCGIVTLDNGQKRVGAACICERGRTLYDNWRSKDPKTFNLADRPEWIDWLEEEYREHVEKASKYQKNSDVLHEIKERMAKEHDARSGKGSEAVRGNASIGGGVGGEQRAIEAGGEVRGVSLRVVSDPDGDGGLPWTA